MGEIASKEVSIIIVSYNTRQLLRNCLESISAYTRDLDFEVLVVDNDSSDGSVEMVGECFPEVRVLESGGNIGFGRANNLGMEAAVGRFFLLLNSDTLLVDNSIKILYDYMCQNPTVGICGGNLYSADMRPAQSFLFVHTIGTEVLNLMPNCIKRLGRGREDWFNHSGGPRRIGGYISGADIMIGRQTVEELGGFDPDFFMYYEDMELNMRVRRSGRDIVSVPAAGIVHLEGQSCTVSIRKFEMLLGSKYLFYEKVHSRRYARRVYRVTQALYGLYTLLYRVTARTAKAETYASWAAVNRKAWAEFARRG